LVFLASIGSYGGIPHFVYEVNVVDASDAVVGTGEPLDSNYLSHQQQQQLQQTQQTTNPTNKQPIKQI
jgi:hypothetical protein